MDSINLPKVANRSILFTQVKRISYGEDGSKSKKTVPKICRRFNPTSGEIDQKIPITAFLNLDKNRQADTMKVEFYFKTN